MTTTKRLPSGRTQLVVPQDYLIAHELPHAHADESAYGYLPSGQQQSSLQTPLQQSTSHTGIRSMELGRQQSALPAWLRFVIGFVVGYALTDFFLGD